MANAFRRGRFAIFQVLRKQRSILMRQAPEILQERHRLAGVHRAEHPLGQFIRNDQIVVRMPLPNAESLLVERPMHRPNTGLQQLELGRRFQLHRLGDGLCPIHYTKLAPQSRPVRSHRRDR